MPSSRRRHRTAAVEHELLRRASEQDLTRLALLAPAVAGPLRSEALHRYVEDLGRVVDCQDRFLRDVMWPTLSARHHTAAPLPYADDLARADAAMCAAVHPALGRSELAHRLAEAARLIAAVRSAERQELLPLLQRHPARIRLQLRFRRELPAGVLAFVIPWALRHASAADAHRLLTGSDPAVGVALTMFGPRFATREQLIFGPPVAYPSVPD
jgi:hypothetical protein